MPTAVLDLDLSNLPDIVEPLAAYEQALILIRFKGYPVGQVTLPVINGQLDCKKIRERMISAASSNFWKRCLQNYLNCNQDKYSENAPPPVTVAICTRDRPDDLRRCLENLMKLPDDGQEILVIDNCPATDATKQVVSLFPQVKYVLEKKPGLDVARNRALYEAKHEIVAFTDDDAAPDPNWLRMLTRNFSDPLVLAVTGLIMPLELETKAQEWFEIYSPFGKGFERYVFDDTKIHPLATGSVGAGANMALRRCVLKDLGGFDECLDAGTPTCSGGDHEYFSRILSKGYRIVYEPGALSWHRHRRTWDELRKTLRGYGVGVYSWWTRKIFLEKDWRVIRPAIAWLLQSQIPIFLTSLLRLPGSVPLDLILAELSGCLVGPIIYLKNRRNCT
jgi:cellulose synthase/poly-beta-1,6-N-acetylglucosamine synthase-like glycosyltransferase